MDSPGFWAASDFDAALALGTTYLAYALRFVDKCGIVRGFTNIRRPQSLATLTIPIRPGRNMVVPATLYQSKGALRVTNLQMTDDPSQTDNMEATLAFGDFLPELLVRAGGLDNCPYHLLVYDWKTPVGIGGKARAMLRLRGKLGERTIRGPEVTFKLRSLSHQLRGDVLETTSRDSRARWGDPELGFADVAGDISHDGYPFRSQGAIDEVDPDYPRRRFRWEYISGMPDDRFIDGTFSTLVPVPGGAFETVISIQNYEATDGWVTLASDAPFDLYAGLDVSCTVRAPRTIQEHLTYFDDARYFAGEAGIPTVESANRINQS